MPIFYLFINQQNNLNIKNFRIYTLFNQCSQLWDQKLTFQMFIKGSINSVKSKST